MFRGGIKMNFNYVHLKLILIFLLFANVDPSNYKYINALTIKNVF